MANPGPHSRRGDLRGSTRLQRLAHHPATTTWRLYRRAHARLVRHDGFGRASQMAYSALFSVFPALLILVAIVQRWGSTALIDDLRQVAEKHLPTEMVAVLDLYLRQLLHERFPAALTFGTLTLLWLASRFLNAVLKGLSITYPEQRTRRALTRRLIAIVLVIGFGIASSVAFNIFVLVGRMARAVESAFDLGDTISSTLIVLRWPLAFGLVTLSVLLFYAIVPVPRLRLGLAWPGALTFSGLWVLMTGAFSAYLSAWPIMARTYGAITGIMMLLSWFYLTSLLLFFGAEVNAAWLEWDGDLESP